MWPAFANPGPPLPRQGREEGQTAAGGGGTLPGSRPEPGHLAPKNLPHCKGLEPELDLLHWPISPDLRLGCKEGPGEGEDG